jgi:hypothetical protein
VQSGAVFRLASVASSALAREKSAQTKLDATKIPATESTLALKSFTFCPRNSKERQSVQSNKSSAHHMRCLIQYGESLNSSPPQVV